MANKLSEEEIAEYRLAFSQFDKDGSGTITTNEFETVMRALGQNPTKAQIQAAIKAGDSDGNKTIDFDEFITLMSKQDFTNKSDLRAAFRVFDKDDNGFVSPAELRHVMKTLGNPMSDEEMDAIMEEVDLNGDGKLNYEEFISLMTK